MSISLGKGGAERSCALLSEMLHEQGYEVHLAILNDDIDYPFKGTLLNLGKLKKQKDGFGNRMNRLLKLRKYLKEHQIDLVIDHRTKNNYPRELFYQNMIYKGFRKIYVVHSANPDLYLTNKPVQFAKVYNRNVRTVGVSNHITAAILPQYGIENAVTLHNAFDPEWEKNGSTPPKMLLGKKYFLSYGRIDDAVKDYSFLLRAFNASKVWETELNLVVMGSGPDLPKLQRLAEQLPAGRHIFFVEHISNPFPIIKNAQFVTLTSRFEGFPMVLVETLSLGIPVVSLDIVSGPSEIINHGENGLLIPKREVSLFAEAIEKMALDKVFRQHCRNNAKASVSQYSKQEISKKWNQLIAHAVR